MNSFSPSSFSPVLKVVVIGPIGDCLDDIKSIDSCYISYEDYRSFEHGLSSLLSHNNILIVSHILTREQCVRIITLESEATNHTGIGFIIGVDIHLVKRSLRKIATTSPSPITGRCVSLSHFEDNLLHCHFLELISSSSSTRIASAINASHELGSIFLGGHSDGVCHRISNFAICTQGDTKEMSQGLNSLPCFLGSSCRFHIDSETTVSRLNASFINSQLIIDLTCYGFLLESEVLDCKHGHGRAFLENPLTQALITTMSVVVVESLHYLLLFYLAHDGLPVGLIASHVNRHYKELMRDAPFIVHGDPRIRLHPQVLCHTLHVSPGSLCGDLQPSTLYSVDCILEKGNVLLFKNVVDAVYCLNNKLYFCTKPSCEKPVVSTVPLAQLRSIISFEKLSPSLAFAQLFITHLNCLTTTQDSRLAQLKKESITEIWRLQQFILKHNSGMVHDRHAVDLDQLSLLMSEFYNLVVNVANYLANSSLCAHEAGCNVGIHVNDCFCFSGAEEGRSCSYCGSDIISLKQSLVGLQYTRISSYCYSCGPLHFGNTLIGPLLLQQNGNLISFELSACNSSSLRLPVRGLAWLQGWADIKPKASLVNEVDLQSGDTVNISGSIEVPANVLRGVTRIYVLLFLGPQIELVTRQMPIDGLRPLSGIDDNH